MNRIARAALPASLLLTITACGAITERAVEEATERAIEADSDENVDLDIDADGEEMTINMDGEDGDQSFTIGGGEIPADFPVPVPDGGEVQAVMTQAGAGGMVTVGYDAAQWERLIAFYDDFFATYPDTTRQEVTGDSRAMTWTSSEGRTNVWMTETEGQAVVMVTAEG
jgi:hypothetical protein